MFIERLLNQGNAPLLEQVVKFASARHQLIAENVANVDTPGYRQRDMSIDRFQSMLRDRVDRRRGAPPGSVRFGDVGVEAERSTHGILFHDDNNRSMEQLSSDLAKNALMHNVAIELLKKQYASMETALRERIV